MTPPRRPEQKPASMAELDARIALAEAAVMARDERIRRRSRALVRRVKRGAVRHAGAGLAVAIGAGLATWWLGRGRQEAPTPPPPPPSEEEHRAREAGLSLASLLPLFWPYLPERWRKVVTPGMASTVLALVAPLAARLFRRRREAR